MAIKLFLCDWIYDEGWASYIRHHYTIRHAQMRVNRKKCLVAIKGEDVSTTLENDSNVNEILYKSDNAVPENIRNWIKNNLDITVPENMTYKTLFQKAIRRKDLKFDLVRLKKFVNLGKGSLHIDLLNREMDL